MPVHPFVRLFTHPMTIIICIINKKIDILLTLTNGKRLFSISIQIHETFMPIIDSPYTLMWSGVVSAEYLIRPWCLWQQKNIQRHKITRLQLSLQSCSKTHVIQLHTIKLYVTTVLHVYVIIKQYSLSYNYD